MFPPARPAGGRHRPRHGPRPHSCALFGGGGHLDDALDAVPSDVTSVEFVDQEATFERLGLEDASVDDYVEALDDQPFAASELAPYLEVMAEDAAFDERDVIWSVSVVREEAEGDSSSATLSVDVYQLDDDVDLDAFADDLLAAGLEEDDLDGRRHLEGEASEVTDTFGFVGEVYPRDFFDVTIDEDEHLVLVGPGADEVLETIDGDRDSLTDADTYDDLLDGVEDVEYALLSSEYVCTRRTEWQADPDELGLSDLRMPERTAYTVAGEDATTEARLEFSDDDEAEADLEARRDYLADGLLIATRAPVSDRLDADQERDGSVVKVALDLDEPLDGRRLAFEHDGFFACPDAS